MIVITMEPAMKKMSWQKLKKKNSNLSYKSEWLKFNVTLDLPGN